MSEKVPEKYTPEYCSSVHERMKLALDAAVKALSLTNQNQKELTIQTIKSLEDSFDEIEKDIEHIQENIDSQEKKIEAQDNKISDFCIKIYGFGIVALVFLVGFIFSIVDLTKKIAP